MNSRLRTPQPRSEGTRTRILDTALRLFNEHGTATVSTNRIAEEAGLSPGNLYYHFHDKQEIIRDLHRRYVAGFDDRYTGGEDVAAALGRLRHNLVEGLRWTWEYRFFERELLALLRADPQLRDQYLAVYHRRRDEWSALGERLVAQGMVRQLHDPMVLSRLTLAIWLIAESWLTFVDLTEDPRDPTQVADVAELVMVVLDPYLTEKGHTIMSTLDDEPPGR